MFNTMRWVHQHLSIVPSDTECHGAWHWRRALTQEDKVSGDCPWLNLPARFAESRANQDEASAAPECTSMGCRVGPLNTAQQCLSVCARCLLLQLLPAFLWPSTGVFPRLHNSTLQQRWQVSDRRQHPLQHADPQSTPGRRKTPLHHEFLSSGAAQPLLCNNPDILQPTSGSPFRCAASVSEEHLLLTKLHTRPCHWKAPGWIAEVAARFMECRPLTTADDGLL